jgi:hypothetical protein
VLLLNEISLGSLSKLFSRYGTIQVLILIKTTLIFKTILILLYEFTVYFTETGPWNHLAGVELF